MSQSDMSVCEQSFHFSNAPGTNGKPGGGQSEYSYKMTGGAGVGGSSNILGSMGGGGPKSTASASLNFANLDDAKTLSQADGV